jgi:hypothetical protein
MHRLEHLNHQFGSLELTRDERRRLVLIGRARRRRRITTLNHSIVFTLIKVEIMGILVLVMLDGLILVTRVLTVVDRHEQAEV